MLLLLTDLWVLTVNLHLRISIRVGYLQRIILRFISTDSQSHWLLLEESRWGLFTWSIRLAKYILGHFHPFGPLHLAWLIELLCICRLHEILESSFFRLESQLLLLYSFHFEISLATIMTFVWTTRAIIRRITYLLLLSSQLSTKILCVRLHSCEVDSCRWDLLLVSIPHTSWSLLKV